MPATATRISSCRTPTARPRRISPPTNRRAPAGPSRRSASSELIAALRHCGDKAHAAGLTSWQHFSPHYTSWQANDDDRGRFGWYDDLAGAVDGLNYQTMGPYWSPASLQARIVDTLWLFGQRGNDFKFRMEEDYAAWMWDNDEVTVPVEDVSAAGAFYEYDVIESYVKSRSGN